MHASLFFLGILSLASALGALVPVAANYVGDGEVNGLGTIILSVAAVLLMIGGVMVGKGWPQRAVVPAPVRAAIFGNTLFIAFFVLELSDGLLRQHGRVFYWTSVLFVPALLMFHGLVSGRAWAWWTARAATALLILWFAAFMVFIPFGHLKRGSEVTPWYGRLYMMVFTLVLASVVAAMFRALGSGEARRFFRR
jgi:hypothetical protein